MGELEGNELAEVHIYTQTFKVTQKSVERNEIDKRFHTYINRVLDEGGAEIGIVFYKGLLYSHPDANDQAGKYSVEFHLLSAKHWDENRRNRLLKSQIYREHTENFVRSVGSGYYGRSKRTLHGRESMKRKTHESRCKNCGFVTLSLLSFPILSVSVAWFSWPHLIGTEVIYIMAGIGYRPKFFKEYFRIVEKSESFGNPIIDRFPTNHKDVMSVAPAHVETMKKCHLLSEHPTNGEVFKTIATLKLSAMYLRKRNTLQSLDRTKESPEVAIENLDIMMAARKGYIGKSNNMKVGHSDEVV
ncbi:uncharacterized protein LOC130047213 [Ostrea edulis]|uniref:uncharacterized protein LOC130047213 n=1 Tax=Ostrea edulis TaxID=37623 RepID=UPI0024AED1AD|nr:uncharacterized protein LOC130047213 [Ostrea edulis]